MQHPGAGTSGGAHDQTAVFWNACHALRPGQLVHATAFPLHRLMNSLQVRTTKRGAR